MTPSGANNEQATFRFRSRHPEGHHRPDRGLAENLLVRSGADLRVPLCDIPLSEGFREEPVRVVDPSGPYTDNDVAIDVEKVLKRARINRSRNAAASRNMTAAR